MTQLPLFPDLPPVALETSWEALLGGKQSDMPDAVRRRRWEEWLRLCKDAERVAFWTDASACAGCRHVDGSWCSLQQLPVTVNPYLTLRTGMIGMACYGAGYEAAAV